jgi:Phage minor capsid protein 2.
MINERTIKALAKATGKAEKEIRRIIREVAEQTIAGVDNELNGIFIPLPRPTQLDVILAAYAAQVFRELDNFVNQSLITTTFGEGTVARMYRRIIEETTAKVLAGMTTVNRAMAETVIKWAGKGLNTGFVDRAGRTWPLEPYANMVIRTTVNRTYNELRTSRMQEYGVDLVLVSSVPDPRPACSHIQGKVASLSNPSSNPKYPSVYEFGYGQPWGLRGINCRHQFYPFIEGVNENNQKQYDIREAQKRYELSQKQRYYERQIRKAKRALKLAEEVGDEELIRKYKNLVSARQARIREFIAEHSLTRRYEKERVVV